MTMNTGHQEAIMEVSVVAFNAERPKIMHEFAKNHESVIITKRGKRIAKLVPMDEPVERLFGCMAGTVAFEADIVGMLDADWAALSGEEDHLYRSADAER
jgi:antitoxin (DNA-binding transcriptional repressor) of toxin-antitoxin stability system